MSWIRGFASGRAGERPGIKARTQRPAREARAERFGHRARVLRLRRLRQARRKDAGAGRQTGGIGYAARRGNDVLHHRRALRRRRWFGRVRGCAGGLHALLRRIEPTLEGATGGPALLAPRGGFRFPGSRPIGRAGGWRRVSREPGGRHRHGGRRFGSPSFRPRRPQHGRLGGDRLRRRKPRPRRRPDSRRSPRPNSTRRCTTGHEVARGELRQGDGGLLDQAPRRSAAQDPRPDRARTACPFEGSVAGADSRNLRLRSPAPLGEVRRTEAPPRHGAWRVADLARQAESENQAASDPGEPVTGRSSTSRCGSIAFSSEPSRE